MRSRVYIPPVITTDNARDGAETSAQKTVNQFKALRAYCTKNVISRLVKESGSWLKKVLTDYYTYLAIPGNHTSLQVMRTEVEHGWIKALRVCSQKGSNLNWCKMQRWIHRFSPHTRVRHPHPNQRFHL
jgi:hypothetical protein